MTWAIKRLQMIASRDVVPPPIVETLRLGLLDDWGEGWVRKTWKPSAELATGDGSLFGGYISALADQILAFATMTVVPGDKIYRTLNLQVNFLRVGRQEPLEIIAKVVSQTKQLITVRTEFFQRGDRLIADATAQQILMPLIGPPNEPP